jgi:hypothetical protein
VGHEDRKQLFFVSTSQNASMFAALLSDIRPTKTGLFHLTSHINSLKGRAKISGGIIRATKFFGTLLVH